MAMAWGHLCLECSTGQFSTKRHPDCRECSAGRYQMQTAGISCRACPGGYDQPKMASQTCTACKQGLVSGEGQPACELCKRGRVLSAPDSAPLKLNQVFALLDEGKGHQGASPRPDTSQTLPARLGMCVGCKVGRYGGSPNQCDECPRGKYSGTAGQKACDKCPAGQRSESGASTCSACAGGECASMQSDRVLMC